MVLTAGKVVRQHLQVDFGNLGVVVGRQLLLFDLRPPGKGDVVL